MPKEAKCDLPVAKELAELDGVGELAQPVKSKRKAAMVIRGRA